MRIIPVDAVETFSLFSKIISPVTDKINASVRIVGPEGRKHRLKRFRTLVTLIKGSYRR
jgi:hypothetical protein